MNESFINGFIKAAQATGMSDSEIEALLKQANPAEMPQEAAPEMEQEAAPEMAQEATMAEDAMGGGEEQELEQLLSQLSPEEIEQLAGELANEMQGEGEANPEMEQLPELAAAIEQELSQNPEVAEALAPSPEMNEEVMAKQSAINFIKSAEYVEGFLEQAVGRGMNLKQAVELYDSAFSTTLNQLKTSELKGDQHKLDVDGDGKIEADDLKKLREGKAEAKEAELKGDQHKLDVDGDGKIESDDLKKLREGKKKEAEMIDEKTAAYYEGVIERCREYGLTDDQAIEIVKSAAPLRSSFQTASARYPKKAPARVARKKPTAKPVETSTTTNTSNAASELFEKLKNNKQTVGVGAAGLAAGGLGGYAMGKKDE